MVKLEDLEKIKQEYRYYLEKQLKSIETKCSLKLQQGLEKHKKEPIELNSSQVEIFWELWGDAKINLRFLFLGSLFRVGELTPIILSFAEKKGQMRPHKFECLNFRNHLKKIPFEKVIKGQEFFDKSIGETFEEIGEILTKFLKEKEFEHLEMLGEMMMERGLLGNFNQKA